MIVFASLEMAPRAAKLEGNRFSSLDLHWHLTSEFTAVAASTADATLYSVGRVMRMFALG